MRAGRASGDWGRSVVGGAASPTLISSFVRCPAVEQLDLEYPRVTQDQRKELAAARAEHVAEKPPGLGGLAVDRR